MNFNRVWGPVDVKVFPYESSNTYQNFVCHETVGLRTRSLNIQTGKKVFRMSSGEDSKTCKLGMWFSVIQWFLVPFEVQVCKPDLRKSFRQIINIGLILV